MAPDNPMPPSHQNPAGDGPDGRDTSTGKFLPGHKFGKGNPGARRVQKIRHALLKSIDPAAVARAAKKMMALAEEGDRQAFSEILDRTIGRPAADTALVERLERLERLVTEQLGNRSNGHGRH